MNYSGHATRFFGRVVNVVNDLYRKRATDSARARADIVALARFGCSKVRRIIPHNPLEEGGGGVPHRRCAPPPRKKRLSRDGGDEKKRGQ